MRRCRELQAVVPPADVAVLGQLLALLQEAIDLGERRDELTAVGFARRVEEIENRLDRWLFPRRRAGEAVERLRRHLCAHRGEWLVFLHERGVPPTNNHAEQMLRPAVISRKIGGCNKTAAGSETHSILSSVLVSAQRLGHNFVELVVGWWRQGAATALS